MGLFKPDLYRSLAIGFLIGLAAVSLQSGPELWQQFIPAAQAATVTP